MEIRRESVSFPPASGSGPLTSGFSKVFPREVLSAVAGLAGFSSGYADQKNRPFGELQVSIDTTIESNVVHVDVRYGLRDWSGNFDDAYIGLIDVVVLAELEGASPGVVREDLQITGMEFNQATQFFRSAEHLQASEVRPDNSIPLVAGKPTGVRVYVDYDMNSGLPAISSLSGKLEVNTPTQTVTLTPIESIAPRRDSQINRGVSGHTLNFIVDGGLCRNEVEFRCHVFDAADPTQQSRAGGQTQRFIDLAPVKLFVVGVHYTGQGEDLPAPTLQEFLPHLSLMERA